MHRSSTRLLCNNASGKIVTIETVPLKLGKKHWQTLNVNPDHTYFPDDYSRHVLYITRIYFRYGEAEPELIGQCIVDRLLTCFQVVRTSAAK